MTLLNLISSKRKIYKEEALRRKTKRGESRICLLRSRVKTDINEGEERELRSD